MRTFIGDYSNGSYKYSNDTDAIKAQLISILNTPIGSRFYYPSYGSRLNEYRFNIINYFTIQMIGQEIKNAIDLIEGIELASITYTVYKDKLTFNIELNRLSNIVRVQLSVANGIAS